MKTIATFSTSLSEKSPTEKLWLSYNVKVVKEFKVAEKSCNYAKCSRIYVPEMNKAIASSDWLRKQFEKGRQAVRRSNRFWAEIWSDLVIEQTLMRSIKCSGGLTRGCGFGEIVRNLWTTNVGFSATVH